ncbi:MAG: Fe-S cluster assembly protein SufD [Thermoguttaceae bacterium]|jgi:Fe-S cluster assembly protein SufD
MTELQLAAGFSQQSFDEFVAARREPDWLVDLRRTAWRVFQELPFPGRPHEEWMRTDIRGFRLEKFDLPGPIAETAVAVEPLLTEGLELAGSAVTIDSRPSAARLDPALAAKGVLFGSLDEMVFEHGERIRPHLLTRAVDLRYDKFAALHAACWSGGTLLYVPKGVVIQQPLHVLSGLSPGGVDLGHCLVVLEEGAEATLLAETHSSDAAAAGLHCGAVELLLGPHARLRYVNLQDWGGGVWHFAHQKALVDRDASLQWTIAALGSRLAKVNQHVALAGEGANVQVSGVMFTDGKQHLSYHTRQHHLAPHCTSDLLYKGALQGASRIVWRGMIKVDRDAQKTDGYQRDDNLILSETARADSIPGLEIEADDVKCTHGATVGRVDDEQVFYAQARGLTRREAVRMIVTGFFQQVFDRITVGNVRQALGEAIGRRIRHFQ